MLCTFWRISRPRECELLFPKTETKDVKPIERDVPERAEIMNDDSDDFVINFNDPKHRQMLRDKGVSEEKIQMAYLTSLQQ